MAQLPVDEATLAAAQFDRYERARDAGHTQYVELSKKCNEYYWGDQWDDRDIAKLKEEQRPYLTINEILPTINTILGEQARTRADAQFKPRGKGANVEVANALNKVYLQVTDNNKMEWKERTVFTDGVIGGRGYFDIRMNFDDHIQGEIRLTAEDPHDIVIDPDGKEYDPDEWKEVFKTRWLSTDDVEEFYGKEQAEKVKYLADDHDGLGVDSIVFRDTFANNGQNDSGTTTENQTSDAESEKSVRRIRVIERQYMRMKKVSMWVDNQTGDMREIPANVAPERAQEMATKMNMSIISKMKKAVRWTVTADQFVLFDEWSPYECFTIVPFFAYFRRGRPFGVVENLLSPQDNLNKIASQELHVVNTTANSGWTFESGTLVDMTRDELESEGARTGLVLEHARGSEPPKKILPNQIPSGLDRIGLKAAQFVRDISGVSESMLGYDGAEVSGVAIEKKQSRGLTQMQALFDNLDFTRSIIANRILKLVQKFYTEERIVNITNYKEPEKPVEQLIVNEMTPEGIIANDLTIGEYDIAVSSVPARDTFNDSQFAEALALRNVGVAIPDDTVVEYSNLAHKMDVADRIRQLTGTGEPSEEEAEMQGLMAELQMQRTQLELQELGAKVQALSAKAGYDTARAAEISEDKPEQFGLEQRAAAEQSDRDFQVAIADIQKEIGIKQAQFDTMMKIALLQKDTAEKTAKLSAASKSNGEAKTIKTRAGLSDAAKGRKSK